MSDEPLAAGVQFEDGVWSQVLTSPKGNHLRPCLFLDRDGVIIEDVGYLRDPAGLRLVPDAEPVIAAANARGVFVVIVTNQSGIGRGYYGWPEFAAVQAELLVRLDRGGAAIDAVFACPHHHLAQAPYAHPDPPARKPNPGMLRSAAARLPIDLRSSWIVGDRHGDLEAGRRAGLAGGLLVRGPDSDRPSPYTGFQTDDRFQALTGNTIGDALSWPLLIGAP